MAPKELAARTLKIVEKWHQELDSNRSTAMDSFIACAGIKVAELLKTKWPVERADFVSTGGRFRSTGPFVQGVLKRFGEQREYTSEGGRTTGSCIEAASLLLRGLSADPTFVGASSEDRAAVGNDIQEWIYNNIVKPSLDSEGLRIEINLQKIPPDIIADILAVSSKRGVSGAVAQHLIGAKLAIRYPEQKIENHNHTTQDRQLGRLGDFHLNDTIIHVTMTPGETVVEKCAKSVRAGFNARLLVPKTEVGVAEGLVKRSDSGRRIWVQSIEDFVGQNLSEIGEFKTAGFKQNLKLLVDTYNRRVIEVESRRDFIIRVPENF